MQKNAEAIEINPATGYPETTFARIVDDVYIYGEPHPPVLEPEIMHRISVEGDITAEAFDRVGCGHKENGIRCGLPMRAHTAEHTAVVELKRDASKEEIGDWLKSLELWMSAEGVVGFAFNQNEYIVL